MDNKKPLEAALDTAVLFPMAIFCPEETFAELGREESCSLLRKLCEAFPEAKEELEKSEFAGLIESNRKYINAEIVAKIVFPSEAVGEEAENES